MNGVRQCPWCGARLGARDRVCFSCQRALPAAASQQPAPAAFAAANTAKEAEAAAPWETSAAAATWSSQAPPPMPAAPPPAAPPPAAPTPAVPLRLELAWGRDRRQFTVPLSGATIGSTGAADVVIPAP